MKCPHCGYEHGWSGESLNKIQGKAGEFYILPVQLERDRSYGGVDRQQLYACPECTKTFIDH